MQYFSTKNPSIRADFRLATLQGQPSDKGLYFPQYIPRLSKDWVEGLKSFSREAVACDVLRPYVGDTIGPMALQQIISETIPFEIPLVPLTDCIGILELFHGPTLAFKDVGARFMSRCLSYFAREEKKKITVLVATSGDTGGAAAHAFHGVEAVEVVILYPSGKVSNIQELQLTTLGDNITALEVEGNFDDCQRMVKEAFADHSLNQKVNLTSANSINVARWLPQQVYFFFALQQWQEEQPPVIAVPSGNFGNLCAGLLAFRSGLPVQHFVAACNANDAVPEYLTTGNYQPKPARHTLSNAMDVGDPSNFVRILQLFNHRRSSLRDQMTGYSISDTETSEAIGKAYAKFGYELDPHGAVAYVALEKYLSEHAGKKGFLLETAHPVKFDTGLDTGAARNIPASVLHLLQKRKVSLEIEGDYNALKAFLLTR